MAHKICLCVVSLAAPKAHPKEIIRFFAFVKYLHTKSLGIIDVFDDVFRYLGFVWVRLGTDPYIHNS